MLGSGAGVAAEIGVQTTTAQIRSVVNMSFLFGFFMFVSLAWMAEIISRLLANRNRGRMGFASRRQLPASGENIAAPRLAHKGVDALGFQNLSE